tara:strand:+ start:1679 stop:2200 length:522 start_codon:yes stop_codon:yes gene_type:complete
MMIKSNLNQGAISNISNQISSNRATENLITDIEKYNLIIINVKGPEGFGKHTMSPKGNVKSGSYFYYDLLSLETSRIYRNVLAGDNITTIESRAGVSKAGFIGQMCSLIHNGSDNPESGKAYLKPFSEKGLRAAGRERIEHQFAKTVRPTLFGLKAIAKDAVDELKAIYSKDK